VEEMIILQTAVTFYVYFCIISEENDMAVLVTWRKVAGSDEMSRQLLILSTT
jgi:hypothetical protein